MEIFGISTLGAILDRSIEPRGDVLAHRRELSAELQENCQKLATLLKSIFPKPEKILSETDREISEKNIMSLMDDFKRVNDELFEEESPILVYLAGDLRFKDFSARCADFYRIILSLKRILNKSAADFAALQALVRGPDFPEIFYAWRAELESGLTKFNGEYVKVMSIKFSW
ncbi:MAG: hypothetical protein WCH12_04195 [Candidatus Nitrotoga sp.]